VWVHWYTMSKQSGSHADGVEVHACQDVPRRPRKCARAKQPCDGLPHARALRKVGQVPDVREVISRQGLADVAREVHRVPFSSKCVGGRRTCEYICQPNLARA